MTDVSWTDARIELLKKLYVDGLSASQIAAELGGITRNAVIGKVHRLGLNRARPKVKDIRSDAQRAEARRIRRARVARPKIAPSWIAPTPARLDALKQEGLAAIEASNETAPDVADVQRKSLLEVGSGDCHWPHGDPGSADFFFCGGAAITGLSYCAYHARVAYRPATPRERSSAYIPARRAA